MSNGELPDAAYDGRGNVYQVNYLTGAVARYDTSLQNESILIYAASESGGITCDGATDTIWTCGYRSDVVIQWDLSGNTRSYFFIEGQSASALAWDSLHDTLWLYNTSDMTQEQYSKDGMYLSGYYTGTSVWGGEMTPVPAPASLSLLGLGGLGGLATMRRRRR